MPQDRSDESQSIDIPIAPTHGTDIIKDRANERVLHPSKVTVQRVPHTPTVLLKIQTEGYTAVYPLALPTAMQLAKALRRAVFVYLNGPEKE